MAAFFRERAAPGGPPRHLYHPLESNVSYPADGAEVHQVTAILPEFPDRY
jgi:hypothetical protein